MARHALMPTAEIAPPDELAVAPGTIGVHIVSKAEEIEWRESLVKGDPNPSYTGRIHEELLADLDTFKGQLADLDEGQRKRLAPYLHSIDAEATSVDDQYFRGLGRNDPQVVERLINLSPDKQIVLLRRHVQILEEQTADMQPFIVAQKRAFIAGLRRGVAQGWLSPPALNAIKSVPPAKIYIGDWWATRAEDTLGHFNPQTDDIVVGQGLGDTDQERDDEFRKHAKETIPHELAHYEFDESIDNEDFWLEESMAEHIALAQTYGQADVLWPDQRADDSGTYVPYRSLTAEMMDNIDTALVTRAATSGSTDTPEWLALNRALAYKYGTKHAVKLITARVNMYGTRLAAENPGKVWSELMPVAATYVEHELFSQPWKVMGIRYPIMRAVGKMALWRK